MRMSSITQLNNRDVIDEMGKFSGAQKCFAL